jgi:hypothetical protein
MTTLRHKTAMLSLATLLIFSLPGASAGNQEQWRQSFEETCSKTDQAMTLTVPELRELLEKCQTLQKAIEGEEESVRKVYLKRLQLCRNLYSYVLDYKSGAQSAAKEK